MGYAWLRPLQSQSIRFRTLFSNFRKTFINYSFLACSTSSNVSDVYKLIANKRSIFYAQPEFLTRSRSKLMRCKSIRNLNEVMFSLLIELHRTMESVSAFGRIQVSCLPYECIANRANYRAQESLKTLTREIRWTLDYKEICLGDDQGGPTEPRQDHSLDDRES